MAVSVLQVPIFLLCLFQMSGAIPKQGTWDTQDWSLVGKPANGHEVRITFAVKQHNPGWLKDKLKAVSYPDSPEYTNYMNFDEIAEHVYGEPKSVNVVLESLESMSVDKSKIQLTLGKDFVVAMVPYEAAEKVFQANFFEFQHKEVPMLRLVSSTGYEVPYWLKDHVDFVSGFILFPATSPKTAKKRHGTLPEGELLGVSPDTIATKYNTSNYISSNSQNSQAVAAFLMQYYDPTDLEKFQKRYNLSVKPITKEVGKNVPDDPGAEANLDVQYISATGRNVDTWFISISTYSNGKQEDFLSWIVHQVNTTDSPWVHSASYGDEEDSIDKDYIQRVNSEFMKFGISGRTVLFASGDSGAHCIGSKYRPEWPTSSPYITSVGGTTSLTRVWSDGGGGFSNIFAMPDYQKDTVTAYLNSGEAPSTSHFNASGRAYPDVSVFSTDYIIIDDGLPTPVSGTSCAAPTFAGLVSSLNDVRLNKGQKTLGFLNPLLYTTLKGSGFFDITEGENGNFLCKGFQAIKGWDPASGWGSPNFGLLKDRV